MSPFRQRSLTFANGVVHHSKPRPFDVGFGSSTAAPVAGVRGSYGSDNGHEGGRLGQLSRRDIAGNFAEPPSVPRQILKDIPRPPNSASQDD